MQWGIDSLFSKWCWENCTATCKRIKLDYFLTSYRKINSKQIKVLNLRPETIKLLKENIGITFSDISFRNTFFLDLFPQARDTKQMALHH